ncbi:MULTISPECIES: FecCD family ABC transporter permease [Halomonadaceae]|jgi:iron complex transport system permease protein|uniref:Siderophore transport system permease protein YfhA n=1 Tax=Vreelandella titanicae TaxID=664683 RepID=A0A654AZL1_9GAMM|nr:MULTISPECIES: iron ABC transporter permease [Halomonas]QKS27190.1 putative siderophore transport system permease protein YfhA [Halomonas titanicae]CAD5269749.1 Transport system permease protein [Halomonas sp. I3]CAD5275631.1 Transport system permease protein [Halomonas sp. 113]CAD5276345.1 Transport system permease protein [Halomonas sp. 156]CAD5277353.1 Transport system permease protein [Halomonas sp. 59]
MNQPPLSAISHFRQIRKTNAKHRARMIALLSASLIAGVLLTLMVGQSFTPLTTVLRILGGAEVPGAGFTVRELRLPRAVVSVLVGACFGLGGIAFQTLLRNPLASPDIIGISTGASTGAVFAIVVLSLSGPAVSMVAIAAGLGVALLIYTLSWRQGVTGGRLILIGIGLAAMLQSITAYLLMRAPSWTLQEALRWLTGSVNGAQLDQALPLLVALLLFGGLLLSRHRDLETLSMGDDLAAGLGVRLAITRVVVVITAVALVAFATAVSGPVAFVAFLSGPIAARLMGRNGSLLIPAALVGALLVLLGDYAGQFLLPARYPVGIVTGVLGAPYLVYLILRDNKTRGTL